MKKLITLLIIFLLAIQIFAQNNSYLNLGIGIPVIRGNSNQSSDNYPISSLPTISIEKPIEVDLLNIGYFTISPGLGYFSLKESGSFGGMGGRGSKNLNHRSLNGFIKLIQKHKFNQGKQTQWYFGAVSGVHFFTQTTGSASNYSMFYPQANWTKSDIKESAHDFFHSFYYGIIAGIEPNLGENSRIKPAMEFKLLPAFVSVNEKRVHGFEILVLFGFNTKKKSYPN
ncbi:MAG: hypothetical protein HQ522_23355 [Bacteroidetes bacterium]|nr:hypothetical protein [Bacteroidota bacterium]